MSGIKIIGLAVGVEFLSGFAWEHASGVYSTAILILAGAAALWIVIVRPAHP